MFENLKKVKVLGQGSSGLVYLINKQQKQYALKKIRNIPQSNTVEQGYCLMGINSPYVMKVYDVLQKQKYIYILCQYFNGGDLSVYQFSQQNHVFSLQETIFILKDIILGLQVVHQQGYLHRDIKQKNILIRNQGMKKIYALADFGFAKKQQQIHGTTLGTHDYMSPELFLQQHYGYQVDMWAFGVLFYFMLNAQHPFKVNKNLYDETKGQSLKQLANNFSYKKCVQKTKLKIKKNCTFHVQDLFKRIFEVNAQKRIKFSQIRQHPLFSKYFPKGKGHSSYCYEINSKIFSRNQSHEISHFRKPSKIDNLVDEFQKLIINQQTKKYRLDDQIIIPISSPKLKKISSQEYRQSDRRLNSQLKKITFLRFLFNSTQTELVCLQLNLFLSLKYFILRLGLILVNIIEKQLKQKDIKTLVKLGCKKQKDLFLQLFNRVYNQCQKFLVNLTKINKSFGKYFQKQVTSVQFQQQFKNSYRLSTNECYKKQKSISQKPFPLIIIVLCHGFNQIWDNDKQVLAQIFQPFCLKYLKNQSTDIKFNQKLFNWLKNQATTSELRKLINKFLITLFQ